MGSFHYADFITLANLKLCNANTVFPKGPIELIIVVTNILAPFGDE